MKLHKLSHLLLFFILLFPASGIIIIGCSYSVLARKPGTLSESKLNDIQQGMSGGENINEKGYLVGINSKIAHPVLQSDFRYLQSEQPDEEKLKEWGNYSWGIAINLGDKAGAIKYYTQAITINPQDAEAYNNRGIAKYESGDKAGAIKYYTQAITINPQDAEAYNNRGTAKYELGDKAGAIKDLETAKQLFQQQGNTQNAQKAQELLNKL